MWTMARVSGPVERHSIYFGQINVCAVRFSFSFCAHSLSDPPGSGGLKMCHNNPHRNVDNIVFGSSCCITVILYLDRRWKNKIYL